jgi:hypothetical protein
MADAVAMSGGSRFSAMTSRSSIDERHPEEQKEAFRKCLNLLGLGREFMKVVLVRIQHDRSVTAEMGRNFRSRPRAGRGTRSI